MNDINDINQRDILLEKLKTFIKYKSIKTRKELKNFSDMYKIFRSLSETEKEYILPSRRNTRINTFSDFRKFIIDNSITSREDFSKRFGGIYNKFNNLLTLEERDFLLPRKNIKYAELKDFNSFSKFIQDKNIKSRSEFNKNYNKAYESFCKILTESEKNLLLPKLKGDYEIPSTLEDFKKFINVNNITTRTDLQHRFVKAYNEFSKLSNEEKDRILPLKNKSYRSIITINDLQVFVNVNDVVSRKDLQLRFCYLHKRFSKELDKIAFISSNRSSGERFLGSFFKENSINFITEKTFNDLKDLSSLRYDFYLVDLNILIEYHGVQHFNKSSKYFSEDLIRHDLYKYNYAVRNNIPILYYTNEILIYEKYGYFTEVLTDVNTLLERIKRLE